MNLGFESREKLAVRVQRAVLRHHHFPTSIYAVPQGGHSFSSLSVPQFPKTAQSAGLPGSFQQVDQKRAIPVNRVERPNEN